MTNMLSSNEYQASQVDHLLGQHITIHHHPLSTAHRTQDEIALYLQSLALVIDPPLAGIHRHYLSSLCHFLGYEPGVAAIEAQTDTLDSISVPALLALLKTPAMQACWIVDATLLTCTDGAIYAQSQQTMLQLARALGLTIPAARRLLEHTTTLACSEDLVKLMESIRHLTHKYQSDAWKAVLDFRGISFEEQFHDLATVREPDDGFCRITHDIAQLQMGHVMNGWEVVFTDSLLNKAGVRLARALSVREFRQLQQRAEAYVNITDKLIDKLWPVVSAFGGKRGSLSHVSPANIEPDENTALENTAWYDNMVRALNALQESIDSRSDCLSELQMAIFAIRSGNWSALKTADFDQATQAPETEKPLAA